MKFINKNRVYLFFIFQRFTKLIPKGIIIYITNYILIIIIVNMFENVNYKEINLEKLNSLKKEMAEKDNKIQKKNFIEE